ncbi:hypothetical protein DRQ09_10020, partial [candidate division KSB1 bacterium]
KVSAQQLVDKIAAIVNNEIILHSEVILVTQQRATQLRIDPRVDKEKYDKLKKETLEYLINNKVLLTKAIEDSIEVTDKEVNNVIEQRWKQLIEQLGSEKEAERQTGYNIKQLRKFLKEDVKSRLMIERVKNKMESGVTITRREVEEFFNTMKDSLPEVPESYNVSQILMQVKPSKESEKRAKKKIETIREMLLNGGDFAEFARNYSDDPNSAKNGGDLGMVKPGTFIKEFDDAAKNLKINEISPIIKTNLGYHIIQVIERKGDKYHARHILAALKVSTDDIKRIVEKINKIRDEIIDGADFSEMALKYSEDPEVKNNRGNLGWVTLDNIQVPEFITVLKNLKEGEVSKPFKTRFGIHIIKLNKKEEKHKLSLKKDWDQVEQIALFYKKNREFEKWLENLKKDMFIEIKEDF